MLSGWELGRHVTSIGHRAMLCEIFEQPPDALFAHQDEQLASGPEAPRLLAGWDALQSAMFATVAEARECLVVTGSRSRDRAYFRVETARLAATRTPELAVALPIARDFLVRHRVRGEPVTWRPPLSLLSDLESTLTTQIDRLERDVGGPLLEGADRGRPMRSTQLGEHVLATHRRLERAAN